MSDSHLRNFKNLLEKRRFLACVKKDVLSYAASKGFTLMEIAVVLIIIGILAAISVPIYTTMAAQAAANAAQNNLITIYNAEKSYYFNNGSYCIQQNGGLCNTLALINTNLNLNINDNNFGYQCIQGPMGGPFYAGGCECTATNLSDNDFQLVLKNFPIVLPGGTPPLNPSCTYPAHPNYCPR